MVDKGAACIELDVSRITIGAVSERVDLSDLKAEEDDLSVVGVSVPPGGERRQ